MVLRDIRARREGGGKGGESGSGSGSAGGGEARGDKGAQNTVGTRALSIGEKECTSVGGSARA